MSVNGDISQRISDDSHHKACYVFAPEDQTVTTQSRPPKRRKLTKPSTTTIGSNETEAPSFLPLLEGVEKPELAKLRHHTYKKLWTLQEEHIKSILSSINAKTVDGVISFVRTAVVKEYNGKLPSGLIIAGPNIASHSALFEQLASRIRPAVNGPAIILTSGEAPNLKTALKNLIRKGTKHIGADEDEDEKDVSPSRGLKFLNYDLQILFDFVRKHKIQKVVVAFQDSEAFDGNLLADLINLFSSWLNRIPFVLLFGIATSADTFQEKLPRAAVRRLRGEMFDVDRIEETLERVFNQTVMGPESAIWLGRTLCGMLLERQKDDVQSIQAFAKSLKYAYMSHFYANPLSIFMADDLHFQMLQTQHFEVLRNLSSFRRMAEEALCVGKSHFVRSLLDDDEALFAATVERHDIFRQSMSKLLEAVALIDSTRSYSKISGNQSRSELYLQAVAGQLNGSAIVRDLLLYVKKASSDHLVGILNATITSLGPEIAVTQELRAIKQELSELIELSNKNTPLRSEHDIRHDTMRTTIVAQKVELSKHKSSISSQDATYSNLVNRVFSALESYLSESLFTPADHFPHEILLYNHKSPYKESFTPRPRFAIERALSAPHDYLGYTADEEGLSSTQPATSILYQLYLETGSLINVSDLWSAFYAILGGEDGDDSSESKVLVLFYRALAELRFMGMIKHSRKKTDHLTKMSWKGL